MLADDNLRYSGSGPCLKRKKTQTLRVDVDRVLVNVTVSDSLGRMDTGLQQENFQVWEDKVEQKVEYFSNEDTPLSIGLIFDASGSTACRTRSQRHGMRLLHF